MAEQLPAPPVPPDADITHYDDMPLEVRRLRDSGIARIIDAEIFRCAVLLWCASWHQKPAGSLPDDDVELCHMAGLGRDLKAWGRIKAGVMRGWRLFADGRLYHRVIAEKVVGALNSTRLNRYQKEHGRVRKLNIDRAKKKLPALELPERPTPLSLSWPEEGLGTSAGGNADGNAENGLNRMEGNGVSGRAPTGLYPEDNQKSSPVAARGSLEGSAHDGRAPIALKIKGMT